MCLYSVANLPIQNITHNYIERGHSHMEGDSVHATIENSKNKTEMYVRLLNGDLTRPQH